MKIFHEVIPEVLNPLHICGGVPIEEGDYGGEDSMFFVIFSIFVISLRKRYISRVRHKVQASW